MRRLLPLLAAILVGLSLAGGTIAHAMEPVACIDDGSAVSLGHINGDGDQVPSDSGKAYPHHHGSCHGHVACDRAFYSVVKSDFRMTEGERTLNLVFLPLATAHRALRPPIA